MQQENAERAITEWELAAQTEELRFLNALNHIANKGNPLTDIITLLTSGLQSLLKTDDVSVHYINPAENALAMHRNSINETLAEQIGEILNCQTPELKINLAPGGIYYARLFTTGNAVLLDTPQAFAPLVADYIASNLPDDTPDDVVQSLQARAMQSLQETVAIICPLTAGDDDAIGVLEIVNNKPFPFDAPERVKRIAVHLSGIITRKRAETALRESRNLYQSLIEALPQSVFRKDTEGRFTFVNQNYCASIGRTPEEVVGKTDFDIHPPELARKYRQDDIRVMETNCPLEIIEKHRTLDNSATKIVRTTKTPLHNTAGEIIGIQGIFEDITLQKENEVRLERYARQVDLLHQIDRAILVPQSPAEIAAAVLEPVLQLIPAQRISILLMDEARGIGTIIAAGGSIVPKNLETGKEIPLAELALYNQYKAHPQKIIRQFFPGSKEAVQQTLQKWHLTSSLSVILSTNDELIGSLNLGFKNSDDMLEEYDAIAEKVADSLAVALQQARQAEQIRHDAAIKTRLLQEIDHRVKNNLASIMGMLYLETRFAETNNTPITPMTLKKITARVRSLAALHEMLSSNMWQPVCLRDVALRIFHAVAREFVPAGKELVMDIAPSDVRVSAGIAHNISLALAEIAVGLATYALKHRDHLIVYFFVAEKKKGLELITHCPGNDFHIDVAKVATETLEMRLLRNTVENVLHGSLQIESADNGIITTIQLPRTVISPPDPGE